ncbi:MAG: glucosamine-6-phosphate deaminase [Limnochordales bacterium]|nr:glucosamine-6-phosphate deaminase [Bacillota bacterium]
MDVIVVRDYREMSRKAADIVAGFIKERPDAVLGLPTGNTPKGMYEELVRRHREEGLDFSRLTTFNLDDYAGLGPDHPASFAYYIKAHLLDHVNIPRHQAHWPDALAADDAACRAYEEAIRRAGGLDFVILGIGANGHIAFNEPGTSFDSRTHVGPLAEETRRAAADGVTFATVDDVPRYGITMGIQTILEAKRVLLLASGAGKARAIAAAVAGPVTEEVPASVLQRHPTVTFLLDEAAASQLPAGRA